MGQKPLYKANLVQCFSIPRGKILVLKKMLNSIHVEYHVARLNLHTLDSTYFTMASTFGMERHCKRLEAVKLIKLTFCSETVDRCHQSQANHSFCNCFVTVFGFALTGDRRGVGRWKRELGALVI